MFGFRTASLMSISAVISEVLMMALSKIFTATLILVGTCHDAYLTFENERWARVIKV